MEKRVIVIATLVSDGESLGLYVPVEVCSNAFCSDPSVGIPIKQVLGNEESMLYKHLDQMFVYIMSVIKAEYEKGKDTEISLLTGKFYVDFRNVFYSESRVGIDGRVTSTTSVIPKTKVYKKKEDATYAYQY